MTQEEHNHMVEEFMDVIDEMVHLTILASGAKFSAHEEHELEMLKRQASEILLRLTAPF